MSQKDGIFAGLKVIDCASFIAGPGAAAILSDFGAEVIKVEPPGIGDPMRYTYRVPPNPPAEQNYYWELPNRNKRGVALNLKSAGGADVLKRLIQSADVFVINFPPHVLKALGLTYEEVSAVNPRIVYANLTGYGDHGPEANKPGYDITAFWARTGLMDQGRAAGAPPALPVPGSGDLATATTLYAAIATGLYRREKTGKGCHVSTSLIAAGAWSAGIWLQAALAGATIPGLIDREHPNNALVNPYASADNRWILLLLVQEDKEWQSLVKALGRPELAQDPRFAEIKQRHANAVALVQVLDEVFRTQPLEYWRAVLDQERITFGVVQSLQELAHDPQLLANEILRPMQNGAATPTLTVDSPLTVHEEQKAAPRPAPGLGQHTVEVLTELGYDAAAIEKLSADGVIPATEKPVPVAA
ncbi:MAG: CoA-transferase [Chthonomonadaceae bacterium]|nr:CoA-transferase [Chthonomonadaceae bacterium]